MTAIRGHSAIVFHVRISTEKLPLRIVVSLCFAGGCTMLYTRGYPLAARIVCAVVLLVAAFAIGELYVRRQGRFEQSPEKSINRCALVFGILFALAAVAGHAVFQDNTLHEMIASPKAVARTLATLFGIAIVTAEASALIWQFLEEHDTVASHATKRVLSTRTVYFVAWAIIFTSWIPTLLAFWPGMFSYDMPKQSTYVFTNAYTSHHPPLHTWIVGLCLHAEGFLGLRGITIYELLQMLVISASLASLVAFIRARKMPRWLVVASVVFFVCPLTSMMCLCPTKDVFFAACFIPLLIQLCRVVQDPEARLAHIPTLASIALLALGCCLFRNNFVYALVIIAILCVVVLPKRATTCAAFAVPIVATLIISGPIYSALGIAPGHAREALVLPIHQVARVLAYEGDTLTSDQIDDLNYFFDANEAGEIYNPRFGDPTKDIYTTDDSRNAEFIKLWAKIGLTHPVSYLYSALSINLPYWYLGAPPVDSYSQRIYLEVDDYPAKYYQVEPNSKLPAYYDFLYGLSTFETLEKIPGARFALSLAMPLWILLFGICSLCGRNRSQWRRALALMVPLLFLLTFFAGPVSNMRYVFPFFFASPLFFCVIAFPNRLFAGTQDDTESQPAHGRHAARSTK